MDQIDQLKLRQVGLDSYDLNWHESGLFIIKDLSRDFSGRMKSCLVGMVKIGLVWVKPINV